jgi:hypothetical protein
MEKQPNQQRPEGAETPQSQGLTWWEAAHEASVRRAYRNLLRESSLRREAENALRWGHSVAFHQDGSISIYISGRP